MSQRRYRNAQKACCQDGNQQLLHGISPCLTDATSTLIRLSVKLCPASCKDRVKRHFMTLLTTRGIKVPVYLPESLPDPLFGNSDSASFQKFKSRFHFLSHRFASLKSVPGEPGREMIPVPQQAPESVRSNTKIGEGGACVRQQNVRYDNKSRETTAACRFRHAGRCGRGQPGHGVC